MSNPLSVLAAQQGTFLINDQRECIMSFDSVIVLQAAIITSLKIDGVEVITEYTTDNSISFPVNTIIRSNNGKKFSSITLDEGIVSLVL
jgi:hypothetical protein